MRGVEQIPWLYDVSMALFERIGLKRWREWLVRGAKGKTLDLGCGTGRNLPLAPPNAQLIGVDPALGSLRTARTRSPGTPLVCASAHALPFRDGTFETVLCGLVLCSIPEVERGLTEARRVLSPSGMLRALEHVRVSRVQDALAPAWHTVTGGCHLNRETEKLVEAGGFEILEDGRRSRGVMRRFVARAATARAPRR